MKAGHPIAQWIEAGEPVLVDGAMGTMLHARGFSFDSCLDDLNRTHPGEVMAIHQAYLDAGARIIETNSFGANRFKLAKHGLDEEVDSTNKAAAEVARRAVEASGGAALVAGSVGPLGVRIAPFGRVSPEQALAAFSQQIEALLDGGVDMLMLETHSDLFELREAIRAARQLTDLPLIASVTFTRDDRTLLGDTASRVAGFLVEAGADIVGANCSEGPSQLLRLLQEMQPIAGEVPLCVMPNAGWPERVADRIMYPATADYFAQFAASAARAGVHLVGGCCGTTPDHISHMREALDSVSIENLPPHISIPREPGNGEPVHEDRPTDLAEQLKSGRFVFSVELDPPRGFSTHKTLMGAHLLAESGADVINVADSPMARMRMSPWAVCQLIQGQVGIETVLHFPTRGRNLLRVQGDLLASHALDVRNIFVVMGDPTAVGDYPEAMDNYDLVPTGLIRLIKDNFNTGVDHSGADIGGATSFFVGCALNMGSLDLDREARLLHRKITSGADFALTQPLFETASAHRFLDHYESEFGELSLPILVGILPLYNARHATFLHNEVPGIVIPEGILHRVENRGDEAAKEGIDIAIELLRELQPLVAGTYLMPPFGRYDMAAEVIEAAKVPVAR
jgi:homocysteine S-methyltransferase